MAKLEFITNTFNQYICPHTNQCNKDFQNGVHGCPHATPHSIINHECGCESCHGKHGAKCIIIGIT